MAASTAIATLRPDFSLDVTRPDRRARLDAARGSRVGAGAGTHGRARRSQSGAEVRFPRGIGRAARVVPQRARRGAGGALADAAGQRRPVRSQSRSRATGQLGFDPQHVVVASAVPGESGYDPEQRSAYFTQGARSRPDVARRRARRMGGLDSDGDRERWRALLARKPASESRRATAECRDGSRRSRLLRRRQHTDSRRSRVHRSRRCAGRAGGDRQPDTRRAVVAWSERSRPFLRP